MLSWLQTLSCLLLLALNTAFQPVGRVLGVSAKHSIYLRFSPFICAVDALSFFIHLFAYCLVLHIPAHEALLLIGRDRFNEAEAHIDAPDKKSLKAHITHGLKIAGHSLWFVFGVLRPALIVSLWTGPWMAGWALMYAVAYAVLGLAAWYMRRQLRNFQYTRVQAGSDDDAQDTEDGGTAATSLPATDTVAGTDELTIPDIVELQARLTRMDTLLLRWSVLLQTLLLLWAIICLIQPPLNHSLLSSTSPSIEIPLYFLSVPLIYGCLALILFGSIALGYGILQLVAAAGRYVKDRLPDAVRTRGEAVVDVLLFGSASCVGIVGFFSGSLALARVLSSERMQWLYRAVALDAFILLLVAGACFGFYVLLKATLKYHAASLQRFNMAQYLNEEASALLTYWLVSLVVAVLWFRFRYDTSGHWMQEWRDALVDGRTSNSTKVD